MDLMTLKSAIRKAMLRLRKTKAGDIPEKRFLDAAYQSNLGEITRCIDAGVNPNCRDGDGCTALHLAAERGDLPLALKLLTCPRILIELKSYYGYTPLHTACQNQRIKMMKLLLHNGANPNARDRFSKTPLHMAVLFNSIIMVQLLFKHGAEVNVIDTMNNTPLHIAMLDKCFLPMIRLLLLRGADPCLDVGNMPLFLECALSCHTEKMTEATLFLLEYGVDVNVTDTIAKRNALHFVAITGYGLLAAELIERGCDPFLEDFMGKKPIDIAIQHQNEEVTFALEYYMYSPSVVSPPPSESSSN